MKVTMRYFPVVLLASLLLFGRAAISIAQEIELIERPGIAPILEQVTPAVVNISVTGRASIPQNPLLNDPFFKRFLRYLISLRVGLYKVQDQESSSMPRKAISSPTTM